MSLAMVYSRGLLGLTAPQVTIEAHIQPGLPRLRIVGLPETAVKESKDRVCSALLCSGFSMPQRKITVNLAPADLPKSGGRFDLPIALSILIASGQVQTQQLDQYEFLGELGLSGQLRPTQGCLAAIHAADQNGRTMIIPAEHDHTSIHPFQLKLLYAHDLISIVRHLIGESTLTRQPKNAHLKTQPKPIKPSVDLSQIRGQGAAKRALEIAASGGHHILMVGPPGVGKSMCAQGLISILPPLSKTDQLEVAILRDLDQQTAQTKQKQATMPFRSPHHSASMAALVGGGTHPHPGEIVFAHKGILFLDELPHFAPNVLNGLREPLENKQVQISRTQYRITYPADFQLIAAMNPCPCGHYGSTKRPCRCSHEQIQRYLSRISGPLLDRIDLQVGMQPLDEHILFSQARTEELSHIVQARVRAARAIQTQRGKINQHLTLKDLTQYAALNKDSQTLIKKSMTHLHLSARSVHRLLRVARTIADLDQSECLKTIHLEEALQFRVQLHPP